MDWIGLDWFGLHWIGLDGIELGWAGLDCDWIGLGRIGLGLSSKPSLASVAFFSGINYVCDQCFVIESEPCGL